MASQKPSPGTSKQSVSSVSSVHEQKSWSLASLTALDPTKVGQSLHLITLDPRSKTSIGMDEDARFTIGRSPDADVKVENIQVSRRHAEIVWRHKSQQWIINHLKTINGVVVDGVQLDPGGTAELKSGCEFSLGPPSITEFKWKFEVKEIEIDKDKGTDLEPAKKRPRLDNKENDQVEINPDDDSTCLSKKKEMESEEQKKDNINEVQDIIDNLKSKTKDIEEEKRINSKEKDLIEKLKSKFNEELSCTICGEVFIEPMSLPCNHVFCAFCLAQWKKSCHNRPFDCPNCRQKVGREKVGKNIYLENLISTWTKELGPEMKNAREASVKERKEQLVEREKEEKAKADEKLSRGRGGGRGGRGGRRISDYFNGTPATRSRVAEVEVEEILSESNSNVIPTSVGEVEVRTSGNERTGDPMNVSVITLSSNEDNDSWGDDDEEEEEDDSEGSEEGDPDVYYGGYGRCYRCGRRGHWANGCLNL